MELSPEPRPRPAGVVSVYGRWLRKDDPLIRGVYQDPDFLKSFEKFLPTATTPIDGEKKEASAGSLVEIFLGIMQRLMFLEGKKSDGNNRQSKDSKNEPADESGR